MFLTIFQTCLLLFCLSVHPVCAATLLVAAKQGDLQAMKELLARGNVHVNSSDYSGQTALHYAVMQRRNDMVALLLALEPDLNRADWKKRTPLHYACMLGLSEIFRLLVYTGRANLSLQDEKGYTPLHYAVKKNNTSILQVLNEICSHYNPYIDVVDKRGRTLLHLACLKGYEDMAVLLIKSGAGKDNRTKSDNTPLHLACWAGHYSVARRLLEYDADIDARGNRENTSLHYAAFKKHSALVTLLLECGADCNHLNQDLVYPFQVTDDAQISRAIEKKWKKQSKKSKKN
ncbi:MAG: ankyrin repeat domain-containing protein [Epsilonproteobacteria bacterium]|nr:ankyrin repeat domain-containing protein [Campylobacterota bacterium]